MSEWKKVKLGEILNFKRGYDLPKTERINGHFPVVGSNGIIGFHNDFNTAPCLTIGRSGNVGNPHYYNDKAWAHNTTLYVDDYKNNFPKFLFYFLKTLGLENYRGGSAVPTLNRNHIHILDICFPCAYSEQKAIADVLSALDDKIELNNKINKNLEEQAQALFKHWFVDFEESSEIELGKIIDIHDNKRIPISNGQREKMKEGILFPYYGATSIMDYVNGYIFDGEFVLMGEDGSVMDSKGYPFMQFVSGKMWINNHAHVITAKKPFTNYLLFTILKNTNINELVTGAVQLKINQGNLKSLKIKIPSIEVIIYLEKLFIEMGSLILDNEQQNQKLSALRDYLLPKLMSGELRVN